MAAEPAIKYSIITAYSNKGVAAAEKGLHKLNKAFKKTSLARKLTFAAMGASFVALAKSSAQAAIADEKSIKVLAFTLDNLGRSFQRVPIESFIEKLSRSTGIADQEIRPAFGQLITVTNDLAKSYEALALATDIAAITGDDFTVITDALSKGFAGQTTALKKLIPGLDQAAIKAGDMTTLMVQLNKTFGGAAKNNITTYAGQLAILKVSAGKALENIGKGLISFLKGFTKTNSITDLGLAIENLGIKIGDIFRGLPVYLKTFLDTTDTYFKNSWFGSNVLLPLIHGLTKGLSDAATAASAAGKRIREMEVAGGWGRLFDITVIKKFNKATNKTTEDMKKAAATTKLQGMFDLDAIQIAAALKGKISDLDRARLEGMQALKTQATDDDIASIKKIEYETLRANASANSSQQLALQNTFDFYKAIFGAAKDASDKIQQLSFVPPSMAAPSIGGGGGGVSTPSLPNPFVAGTIPDLSYLNFDIGALGAANAQMEAGIAAQQGNITVNVNPSGSGFIGNQDDFLRTVQMALQIGGRNGYSTSGLASG